MKTEYENLVQLVAQAREDMEKQVEKGNQAAGVRFRSKLREIRIKVNELRKLSQKTGEEKNL